MFEQKKFSNILNKIKDAYGSVSELAKYTHQSRSYFSKYINLRIDKPPTPKVLEKIANASKGITTYEELMQICGYISLSGMYDINLNSNEMNILSKMLLDYKEFLNSNKSSIEKFDEQKYLSNLSKESKEKIIIAFRRNSLDLILNNSRANTEKDNYFEFVSEDDAMFPLLDVGDIALVYKQNTIDKSNATTRIAGTYLIKINNQNTIRRFVESQDKTYYTLDATNIACKPIDVKKADLFKTLTVLGRVVEIKNKSAFK